MFHKSCPRCRLGDLLIDKDDQLTCLQCGHELRPLEKIRLLGRLSTLPRDSMRECSRRHIGTLSPIPLEVRRANVQVLMMRPNAEPVEAKR